MDFITLTRDNLAQQDICCSNSDKKGDGGVSSKKAWLEKRLDDGLVFTKLDVRGKVFIEYIPAEKAWCPIEADGYMHINCFWVSGQFKGHGYANRLLELCVNDAKAKGMRGITVLSSKKKAPFLSDPGYLRHKGFMLADTAEPFFELLYFPFEEGRPVPRFSPCAKNGTTDEKEMALFYTDQCPYTSKYVPVIEKIAEERGKKLVVHKIETLVQAKNAPSPFTTYSFFMDGRFVTNEIMSDKKFEKIIDGGNKSD